MGAFHAYDIRGIYNVDFDKHVAYKVGYFLPELLKAAGIEGYGLAPAAAEQEKSAAPDPQVLAAEIEKRIREGYSVNSPIAS